MANPGASPIGALWSIRPLMRSGRGDGVSSMSNEPVDGDHSWVLSGSRDRDHLAVNKDAIAGLTAWHDIRLPSGNFVSDALLNGMHAQNMTGYDIETEWAET